MPLNQNTELPSRNIPKSDGLLTKTHTPEERRLIESRRRLDRIVGQGFKRFDACVYGSPDPPVRHYMREHGGSESLHYMSGALVDSAPIHTNSNPLSAGSANGMREDLANSRPLLIEQNASSYKPREHEDLTSRFSSLELKGINMSRNQVQQENSSLNQVESDNQQFQAVQNRNRATSASHHDSSRLWIPSDSPCNSSCKTGGKCNKSVQNSPRLLHQVRQSRSWRQTPIPAPQPWRKLGILDPFRDDLSSTPINKSPSRRPWTASPSQKIKITSNPPKPRVSGWKISAKGSSELSSSPLKGFPHLSSNDKKRKRKYRRKRRESDTM
ncbi:hypothetical protein F5Y12DRAFT_373894 [Xylaria sp. FL1777]|nr:hypothetical protein F5Y12DRAFT_373894 [Xylaria sp. FL1777]